jgi:hypothetical protein
MATKKCVVKICSSESIDKKKRLIVPTTWDELLTCAMKKLNLSSVSQVCDEEGVEIEEMEEFLAGDLLVFTPCLSSESSVLLGEHIGSA